MPKCLLCKDSNREFHKLSQHIRTIHKMSVKDYKEMFPYAETVSKEYSLSRSEILKKEFREGKMNTPDRIKQVEMFNKKGIDYKQSEEGRKEASELQKKIWESLSDKERSDRMNNLERKKKEWMTNNPEEFRSHQSYAYSKACSTCRITSIHRKVSDYLNSIGIEHENEYFYLGANVDIYIPSLNKVIECNGEFWHGNPEIIPVEDMTEYQLQGYSRDMRRKELFGDNVIFLWESEINDNTYVEKLNSFLGI